MAESELIIQSILVTGTNVSFAVANDEGNYFVNDGKTWLRFFQEDVWHPTVTVHAQILCDEDVEHNQLIAVASNNKTTDAGPFDTVKFNLNGYVHITYSGVSGLKVAAVKI